MPRLLRGPNVMMAHQLRLGASCFLRRADVGGRISAEMESQGLEKGVMAVK